MAFDTETDMPPKESIPNAYRQKMVVCTVTNGTVAYVLGPCDVGRFLLLHAGCEFVAHNARFDYWVVLDELKRRNNQAAISMWESVADTGKLHCTMILDFLVRLATMTKPGVQRMRGLSDEGLGREYGIWVDASKKHKPKKEKGAKKEDEDLTPLMREDFGKYLNTPLTWIPKDFLDYAVQDTVATMQLYKGLQQKLALIKCKKNEYGFLTESLQVKADITLAEIGRRGMATDPNTVELVATRMWAYIQETIKYFQEKYPLLFDYYTSRSRSGKAGEVKLKKDTGLPALKQKALMEYLGQVVEEWQLPWDRIPMTPKGDKKSLSLEPWLELARGHEFVDRWSTYVQTIKQYSFVRKLKTQEAMHADYRVLMRTGRTSCTGKGGGVNIQQWPRDQEMRSMFVARPGMILAIVDYSAIELRTLAAVCLDRFNQSQLAAVIKSKVDPHCYTAAMFMDLPIDTYMAKYQEDKETIKQAKKVGKNLLVTATPYVKARQDAKPINFGVPGGLGPRRLAGYAKAQYGVDMTVERAGELRDKLIKEVYPEINLYLRDTTPWILARNLRIDPNPDVGAARVIDIFKPPFPGYWYAVQKIVGYPDAQNMKNEDYTPKFKASIWRMLAKAAFNAPQEIQAMVGAAKPSATLRRLLFGDTVTTLTGRIRTGVDYGEARNTPFQGLAADGAKLALWELHKHGAYVVAFIHDEVVAEVMNTDLAPGCLKEIEDIMCKSMASVVGHGIPIEVEGKLSPVWSK